jgi:hypothetical protein
MMMALVVAVLASLALAAMVYMVSKGHHVPSPAGNLVPLTPTRVAAQPGT